MKVENRNIKISTDKQLEFVDITNDVAEVIKEVGIKNGTVTVFSSHTTSAIVVNHNESMLLQDMMRILYKLVPIDERYSHDMFELTKQSESDGRSNGHSHCKSLILGASETIPIVNRVMVLGELQSIFFVELDGARKRNVVIQVMGN